MGESALKISCFFTLLPISTRPFTEDTGRLCLCTFFNLSDAFFSDSSAFVMMLQWMTAFSIWSLQISCVQSSGQQSVHLCQANSCGYLEGYTQHCQSVAHQEVYVCNL